MALIRWTSDPWRDFFGFPRDLSSFFDEVEVVSSTWAPDADIYEEGDHYVISIDLPGLSRENVEVKVENNILTISGERKQEYKVEEDCLCRTERLYGKFSRSFTLGSQVSPEGVNAKMEHGVLSILIPKKEEVKPRQIAVS